jgi:hypothetical protein
MDAASAQGPGPFGTCGACGQRWDTWTAFLEDPCLTLVGLQVAEHLPEANLIVFEHACGSSVSVRAARLRFLLPTPDEEQDVPAGWATAECERLCQRLEEWRTCDRPCVNARARRVLQHILRIKEGLAGPRR